MKNLRAALLALLVSSTLLTGCGSLLDIKDRILASVVDYIPWDFEQSMGDQLLPSILAPADRIQDPELVKELETLLKPLTSRVQNPRIRLHISKSPELNAFAIPGGHLIFNKGMLLAAESPEEILGVAAHEIAHATERHTMRSMLQGLGIYAAITIFLGDVSGIGAILIDQGRMLIQNGFSRSQERAADEVGLNNILEARINPQGMLKFFQRLDAEGQKHGGSTELTKFMSTHPLTQERIETIEARVAKVPAEEKTKWKPVAFDLKAFQAKLSKN